MAKENLKYVAFSLTFRDPKLIKFGIALYNT